MPNNRKRLVGRVVSDKMQKTVVVEIERRTMHRVYKKFVKSTNRVMAHDETDAIEEGAIVRVVESKPLSKRKRWVVEEVIQNADGSYVAQQQARSAPEMPPEVAEVVVTGADTPEEAADSAEAGNGASDEEE